LSDLGAGLGLLLGLLSLVCLSLQQHNTHRPARLQQLTKAATQHTQVEPDYSKGPASQQPCMCMMPARLLDSSHYIADGRASCTAALLRVCG
jgi:hypothetical protein